jgi:hypothetical protein
MYTSLRRLLQRRAVRRTRPPRFGLVHADGRGWRVGFGGACDLSQGHRTAGELDQHLDLAGPEI